MDSVRDRTHKFHVAISIIEGYPGSRTHDENGCTPKRAGDSRYADAVYSVRFQGPTTMCGRYTLFTPVSELESRFDATLDGHEPRYNCAPGQRLPVITESDPDGATWMEWGLTPPWAEERFDLINARAETVREKRSFADAYESRRCLVPADGFYEWVEGRGGTRPYRVAFEDDRPFAMAGLHERWRPPEPDTVQTGLGTFGDGGEPAEDPVDGTEPEDGKGPGDGREPEDGRGPDGTVETFTVVTTEPNELVADLHHRMAVILDPDEEATWLHGDPAEAAELMEPHPAEELRAYPVSTDVNDPSVDDPTLVEPVDGH